MGFGIDVSQHCGISANSKHDRDRIIRRNGTWQLWHGELSWKHALAGISILLPSLSYLFVFGLAVRELSRAVL